MQASAPPVPVSPRGIGPKPWGIPAVLLALALPAALWGSSLALSATTDAADELGKGEIVAGLVVTIVLDFVLIGIAAGFSLWRYRLRWSDLGLRPVIRDFWWVPLVAAAAAHAGIIVYSVVLASLGADAAVPEQEELDQLFESRAVLPLTGVATVLMAPIAEEIFFRGFIFAGLLRPLGLAGALVVSGLIFGAFHITGLETVGLVIPFGVIGMLFAWIYYRTGSLWPSIATHLLFNLVSFAALASFAWSGLV